MKKSKLLRGSELLSMLPEDVQQKYVDNMVALQGTSRADDILDVRERRFINMADFLAQSFDWASSTEGRVYWEDVLNAKYDKKTLDEGVDEIIAEKRDEVASVLDKLLSKLSDLMLGSDENEAPRMQESATGKTGNEYLNYLTETERDEYFENAKKFTTEGMLESNLTRKHKSFDAFIRGSFPFIITPQGHTYWAEICERDIEEDLSDVLSELKINTSNGKV